MARDSQPKEAMGELAAEGGAGAGHAPGQVMEYEEPPVKRAELKRAAVSSWKSKAKPTTQIKRPALHIGWKKDGESFRSPVDGDQCSGLGADHQALRGDYSPKRFTARAEHYGLRPGFAVDLEEQKPDGMYWDASREEDVRELDKYVDEVEPTLLTGSPPCDQFSQLQNINKHRVGADKRREKIALAYCL